jgi:flagellar basal body-associated protein FliL
MRLFIRKSISILVILVAILVLTVFAGSLYIAYTVGSVEGYSIGLAKADLQNPLKAHVESGKPFVYDNGSVYNVKRVDGRRALYYTVVSK